MMAVLKVIVDLLTMLIGAEGARLLENAIAFPSCVGGFKDANSMSCGRTGQGDTPQALKRRGGSPYRPRKAKLLERKSTCKFNIALMIKRWLYLCHLFIIYIMNRKIISEVSAKSDKYRLCYRYISLANDKKPLEFTQSFSNNSSKRAIISPTYFRDFLNGLLLLMLF
jgi:hypothetical protein